MIASSIAIPTISPARRMAAAVSAVLLSLVFLASGIWKISDLPATAERMVQLLVPAWISLPGAFLVAGSEALAGVLLLIPSCRRWGAGLASLLLVGFMGYMGVFYQRLIGEDCSCFPWVKRVVGPAFFAGDAAMLLLAAMVALWAVREGSLRRASMAAAGVVLAMAAAYTATMVQRSHADVPETAVVDGQAVSLRDGRAVLYFFDPQCTHCEAVARRMAKWNWGSTRVIALPVAEPQYARSFLEDTGLRAGICLEANRLKTVAPFTTPPHAAVLADGKVIGRFNYLELEETGYSELLRKAGHIR